MVEFNPISYVYKYIHTDIMQIGIQPSYEVSNPTCNDAVKLKAKYMADFVIVGDWITSRGFDTRTDNTL